VTFSAKCRHAFGLVMEWAVMHQTELTENWTSLETQGNFKRIAPLI
jgi:hypothetical protein